MELIEAVKPKDPVEETGSEELAPEIAALVPQYLASKWRQMEEAQVRLLEHDLEPVRRFGHNLRGTGRGGDYRGTGGDYGVTARLVSVPQVAPVIGTSLTLWGVPGDPVAGGKPGRSACSIERQFR